MSKKTLADKVAVVTGGSSGIGEAAAKSLAAHGAKVVVAARREKEGQAVVEAIQGFEGQALFVKTDVTEPAQVSALMKQATEQYGSLDILFNNAGIPGSQLVPIVDETEENLRHILEVNLVGAWRTMKEAIPYMVKAGGGSIINTTSVAGLRGFGTFSSYVASKFALEGLSRSVAQEVAGQGIRINTVAPGPVDTPLLDQATGGDHSAFTSMTHLQRAGKPDEIAAMVVFLASDAASYITGQAMTVDGGMMA